MVHVGAIGFLVAHDDYETMLIGSMAESAKRRLRAVTACHLFMNCSYTSEANQRGTDKRNAQR